jgi:hypothetical protein
VRLVVWLFEDKLHRPADAGRIFSDQEGSFTGCDAVGDPSPKG